MSARREFLDVPAIQFKKRARTFSNTAYYIVFNNDIDDDAHDARKCHSHNATPTLYQRKTVRYVLYRTLRIKQAN